MYVCLCAPTHISRPPLHRHVVPLCWRISSTSTPDAVPPAFVLNLINNTFCVSVCVRFALHVCSTYIILIMLITCLKLRLPDARDSGNVRFIVCVAALLFPVGVCLDMCGMPGESPALAGTSRQPSKDGFCCCCLLLLPCRHRSFVMIIASSLLSGPPSNEGTWRFTGSAGWGGGGLA